MEEAEDSQQRMASLEECYVEVQECQMTETIPPFVTIPPQTEVNTALVPVYQKKKLCKKKIPSAKKARYNPYDTQQPNILEFDESQLLDTPVKLVVETEKKGSGG